MLCSLKDRSVLGAYTLCAALLLVVGCQSESTQQQKTGPPPLPDDEVAIENPWVQPAPAGSTSALYMSVANGRQDADTLLEASAPIIDSSGVYRAEGMTNRLPIPARTRVTLKPGSTHVRLVNLGQSLDENSNVILNLEFAQSGLQRVRVPVRTSPPEQQ
jgi:copper(I)-binding protein